MEDNTVTNQNCNTEITAATVLITYTML